ncbi:MAG: TlpA family protein disulfide reductase [Bacteroidetes bacterium]|nr:TlpA family protein disulfide reductase [Bacteroidota bacterium]
MKKISIILILFFLASTLIAQTEDKKARKLPSVDIKTADGKPFNTLDISNDGNPIILSFWAIWCKPCINELSAIADVYEDWQDETGVKLVAVSIDDVRSSSKVMPFVNGNDWDYEVFLDPNGDFKRAMNVNMIPHTFLVDGNRNIVWSHTSFSEGSELQLIEKVRKLAKGEDISDH